MEKKKKIIIIVSAIVLVLAIIIGLIVFSFSPVSKKSEEVIFVVESGSSKIDIIDDLREANLIKSKISAYGYVFLNSGLNLQAGKYQLDRNMSLTEIFKKMDSGDVYRDTVEITFVEGKRLTYFVEQIALALDVSEEEILATISDKGYLQELIDKYWFLDEDILNDDLYYALEGYLYPAKYEFFRDSTIKNVIEKMLDTTASRLESIKDEVLSSNYSLHEILTMASIVELEAVSNGDREKVSQVIYTRLNKNMSLGMDVTTYYGAKKEMGEPIYQSELNDNNPYNTRLASKKGLPVGPICNPSLESIEAVLNPSDTNYVYFYADIKTGIVYFTETYEEFLSIKKEFGGN